MKKVFAGEGSDGLSEMWLTSDRRSRDKHGWSSMEVFGGLVGAVLVESSGTQT